MLNHRTLSVSFVDSKPHYELLDGLRGVAALLVLIYHIFEGFSFAEVTNGAGSGIITTLRSCLNFISELFERYFE